MAKEGRGRFEHFDFNWTSGRVAKLNRRAPKWGRYADPRTVVGVTSTHYPWGADLPIVTYGMHLPNYSGYWPCNRWQQLVNKNGWWIVIIGRYPDGLRILETRKISDGKALAISIDWGVRLPNSEGIKLPYIKPDAHPIDEPKPWTPEPDREMKDNGDYTAKEFEKECEAKFTEEQQFALGEIASWCAQNVNRIDISENTKYGVMIPVIDKDGVEYFPIVIRTDGLVEMQFQWMKKKVSPEIMQEWFTQTNNAIGNTIDLDRSGGRPTFRLFDIANTKAVEAFIESLSYFKENL